MAIFGYFGHFGLKIGHFWLGNRNKNPGDYKTRENFILIGGKVTKAHASEVALSFSKLGETL